MKFERHIVSMNGNTTFDRALDTASAISIWRRKCRKHGLNDLVVMLIIADGASVTKIMDKLRMKRDCVRAQLRACLTLWSVAKKRCGPSEIQTHLSSVKACCPSKKKRKRPIIQQIQTV